MIDPCSAAAASRGRAVRARAPRRVRAAPCVVRRGDARQQIRDLLADRDAGDAQVLARAVVALHQHADGVAALRRRRTRDAVPMPPLKPWQSIPVPPPTLPSATGPPRAPSSALMTCSRLHVKAVDVVQAAVVGLGHHRQPPRLQARPRDLPLEDRVAHDADAVGVGDRRSALRGCRSPGATWCRSSRRCRSA